MILATDFASYCLVPISFTLAAGSPSKLEAVHPLRDEVAVIAMTTLVVGFEMVVRSGRPLLGPGRGFELFGVILCSFTGLVP